MNKIKTQILSATDTGLVRETNEDSCGTAETPNGILCVVCDGMGGHIGGGDAVNCIIQYVAKEKRSGMVSAAKSAGGLENITFIENPHAECLLGQTILSRFGQYTIDNLNNETFSSSMGKTSEKLMEYITDVYFFDSYTK